MFILHWLQWDSSAWKSSFCLRSGPVNTSRAGPPQTTLSASVWVLLLCTGFLCGARNAQPGCEIRSMVVTHCSALVSIQPVCHIVTKKRGGINRTTPTQDQVTQKQTRRYNTCSSGKKKCLMKAGWVRYLSCVGVRLDEKKSRLTSC